MTAPSARWDKNHPKYKWIALSNTTMGMLVATINGSIVLISLPAIFRGIDLNPLAPGNVSYLLWMIMGFLLVSAVLVVTLGRLGDMYGRVKIYNLGFLVFFLSSVLLALEPFDRLGRSPLDHRLAPGPGHRRRDAVRQLDGDPHRRLRGQPARHGAGRQHGRGHRRLVHRADPRWRAVASGTGGRSSGSACRSA